MEGTAFFFKFDFVIDVASLGKKRGLEDAEVLEERSVV